MASSFRAFGDRALILGRRPRLRLALQMLAFAVLTGSLVYAVRDSWSDAEELLRTADPLSLALGLGAIAAYYLAFVVGWQLILRAMGIELDYRTALRAEMLSMLAKYIPGGVWTPAARVVAVRKVGVRNTPLVLGSIALEAGLSAIAGVAVFVVSLGTVSSRNAPVWPLAAFVLVLVVLLHPRVFSPLMTRIARRLGTGPIPRIRERVLLGLVGYYCLTWLLAGVALFFLARSVGNPPVSSIPYLGGVSAVGAIVAVLVVIAPSGLGVREGAMYGLLVAVMSPAAALGTVVLNRLGITVVELVLLITIGTRRRVVLPPPDEGAEPAPDPSVA
ncbi:MAG: lysylphosphatidylglycerol synthase transmembrane domain-containing protein [Gaiellales bacterium]|jgi:uncharacterized membrane protein YbhN (UPF0104 family)